MSSWRDRKIDRGYEHSAQLLLCEESRDYTFIGQKTHKCNFQNDERRMISFTWTTICNQGQERYLSVVLWYWQIKSCECYNVDEMIITCSEAGKFISYCDVVNWRFSFCNSSSLMVSMTNLCRNIPVWCYRAVKHRTFVRCFTAR